MKQWLTFLFVLYCCATLKAEERVVDTPPFSAWTTTTLEIQKIVLSDTATVFFVDAYFQPGWWIKIAKDSYLLDDKGGRHTIRAGVGIGLDEEFWMPESGTASFQLLFPPLPEGVKVVHFTEGDFEGSFQIWGIRLDGQPVTSPMSGKKIPEAKAAREVPSFHPGTATVTGQLVGYYPEMKSKGSIAVGNIVTGAREEYLFEVAPDGRFSVKVPLVSATGVSLNTPFYTGLIYVSPGKETHVDINLPERARSQSRLLAGRPSLGVEYLFSGAYAELNNEVANHLLRYLSISPRSEEDYLQVMQDIAPMSSEQYSAYWMQRYHTALKELDQHPELSDMYREWLTLNAKLETAEFLLTAPYRIESAYRMVNKLDRDAKLPEGAVPVFGRDYYSVLKELIPTDGTLLYSYQLNYTLQYLQLLGDKSNIFANAPSLAEIMGTDKGVLFDLMKAHTLARPIVEFTLLTDEELAEAKTLPAALGDVVRVENDKLKDKLEANKRKTGYTVNPLDTKAIPNEDLFSAIIEPHRGKVVFVDFWATWCGPCLQAFKTSEETKKEMEAKGVVFLYLAGENSPKGTWDAMIPDIKGEHYRVTGAQWNYWTAHFPIQGVPTYLVVGKDGTIASKQTGFPGADWMRKALTEALGKD